METVHSMHTLTNHYRCSKPLFLYNGIFTD